MAQMIGTITEPSFELEIWKEQQWLIVKEQTSRRTLIYAPRGTKRCTRS